MLRDIGVDLGCLPSVTPLSPQFALFEQMTWVLGHWGDIGGPRYEDAVTLVVPPVPPSLPCSSG